MINFSNIEDFEKRLPALQGQILYAEKVLGKNLPVDYKKFLLESNGFYSDEAHLYSTDDIVEHNETYEVGKYCPEYINIGDDGGGGAILLNVADRVDLKVYMVGHGSMDPKFMDVLGEDFIGWIEKGCPID